MSDKDNEVLTVNAYEVRCWFSKYRPSVTIEFETASGMKQRARISFDKFDAFIAQYQAWRSAIPDLPVPPDISADAPSIYGDLPNDAPPPPAESETP